MQAEESEIFADSQVCSPERVKLLVEIMFFIMGSISKYLIYQ